jgi:D-amino-acid dehydrogenase
VSHDRGHVVVIGAGIIGICCALFLRRRGFAVTVVDPEAPCSQTSSGNAGGFGVAEVMPMSAPGLLWRVPGWLFDPLGPLAVRWRYLPQLLPWLVRFIGSGGAANIEPRARALAALMAPTFDDFMPLLQAAGVADSVIPAGALTVYHDRAGYRADALEWQTKKACGIRCEELDAADVHDLEPDLSPDVRFGVFTPDWRHTLDPHRLATALVDLLEREGGNVQRGRATSVESNHGGTHSVLVQNGSTLQGDRLVVAAGAWSKPFVRQLDNLSVALESERGYNTTLPAPGVQLRREVIFAERKFVATPMEMGLRIGGAAEFAGLTAPPNYKRCTALLNLAKAYFPALCTEGGSQWMGHRPSTPDSLPVISRSPRHANVFYAFGHGHLGLTQAATTGRLIAELAGGDTPSIDIEPFSVTRF